MTGSTAQDLLKSYKKIAITPTQYKEHPYISLGPLGLNMAIGDVQGVHGGKILQLVGNPSCGKSTMCMDIAKAYIQSTGEAVGYVNLERTFDPAYALAVLGPDLIDNFVIFQVEYAEQAMKIAEELVREHGIKLIILDSIAVMVPKSEADKDMEDSAKMAGIAGPLSRFCHRMIPLLDNVGATMIMVNQYRANFSQLSRTESIPFGARALQYANSLTIELARKATEKEKSTILATVRKSKVGSPMRTVEFDITYGRGINHAKDVIEHAIKYNIVTKNGAWFYYTSPLTGEIIRAQGMANAEETFPIDELRRAVIEQYYAVDAAETLTSDT